MSTERIIKPDAQHDAAVDYPVEGTLKILAGAGTGKTRVLVDRYLKFVLEEGVRPDRLLALTFTKKAASEMRERIFRKVTKHGDVSLLRELYGAWIMNFHQFGYRLIRENAPAFGVDPGVEVATALDLSRIMRTLGRNFERGNIEGVSIEFGGGLNRPSGLRDLFEICMGIVAECRSTLWTKEELRRTVKAGDAPGYAQYVGTVIALWQAYEVGLRERNLLDFTDMIRMVVEELKRNEDLRRHYADKFDHILIDEFQDTSEAQNALLKLLAGDDCRRVTVVGDDKQSIYRWRDARVENLRGFPGRDRFLQTNYRSTQEILDLAHRLIVRDPYFEKQAEDIRLKADLGVAGIPICVFHPRDETDPSYEQEARALADWIRTLTAGDGAGGGTLFGHTRDLRAGLGYGEIAILLRSLKPTHHLADYERELQRAGIPYAVVGGASSIEIRALERLRNLLRLLIHPDDLLALLDILEAKPISLSDEGLMDLFSAARRIWKGRGGSKRSPRRGEPSADVMLSAEVLEGLEDDVRDRCAALRVLLGELREKRARYEFAAFVSEALESAHFYYYGLEEGADMEILAALTAELHHLAHDLVARNEGNLTGFLDALDAMIVDKGVHEGVEPAFPAGRVKIMTVHQAKGLEFEAVAVPGIKKLRDRTDRFLLLRGEGIYQTKWDENDGNRGMKSRGNEKRKKEEHDEQEERCLHYVAITRAKRYLFLGSPLPDGIRGGGQRSLFTDLIESLRGGGIPFEEVREAPAQEEVGAPVKVHHGEEPATLERLLEEWEANRARLDDARLGKRRPQTGIEFVTWRGLRMFDACPLKFQYGYAVGAERLRESDVPAVDAGEPDEASPASGGLGLPPGVEPREFGEFLHLFLFEWMAQFKGVGRSFEPLLSHVARRFAFPHAAAGPVRDIASKIAGAFLENPLAGPGTIRHLETPVRARLDRLIFHGIVDRIDGVGGGLRVVDYKAAPQGELHEEYSYQVRFYAWLLNRTAERPVLEGGLFYLAPPTAYLSVSVDTASIGAVEQTARRLEAAVSEGDFRATPSPPVCGSCEFNAICPSAIG